MTMEGEGAVPSGSPTPAGEGVNVHGSRTPTAGIRRLRVLLACARPEDEATTRALLSPLAAHLECAWSGPEALQKLQRTRFDLILVETGAQRGDTAKLCVAVRAWERDAGVGSTPMVALVAGATGETVAEYSGGEFDATIEKPVAAAELQRVAREVARRRPLVIIADDHHPVFRILERFLSREDLDVLHARDGDEAIRHFLRGGVDLILLDLNMPVRDGFSTAREIRTLPAGDSVPIVAVTGADTPEERERALASGCSHFLPKPVRHPDLVEFVRGLFGPPRTVEPVG